MKKEYKNILDNYIYTTKGKFDYYETRGSYGISWNSALDYVSIYKISVLDSKKGYYYINEEPHEINYDEYNNKNINDYAIDTVFFQSKHEYFDILGSNFLYNSIDTQFKKVRNYFKEYMY